MISILLIEFKDKQIKIITRENIQFNSNFEKTYRLSQNFNPLEMTNLLNDLPKSKKKKNSINQYSQIAYQLSSVMIKIKSILNHSFKRVLTIFIKHSKYQRKPRLLELQKCILYTILKNGTIKESI